MSVIYIKANDATKLPDANQVPKDRHNRLWGVIPFRAYAALCRGEVTNCVEVPDELQKFVVEVDPGGGEPAKPKATGKTRKAGKGASNPE